MNNFIDDNHIINTYIKNTNKNKNYNYEKSHSLDLQKNFLSLLIAQIKNQDPIDPMKNTELTSQLAQINTVSQIEKLNNTVTQLTNQNKQNQNIQASSLIGHHVLIPNTQLMHTKNTETKFGIELLNNAQLVNIKIKDKKGNIVFDKNIKEIKSGIHHLLWDGKDLDKNHVDTGQYNLIVTAKNNNQNINVNTFSDDIVTSIITSSPNSSNNFLINLGLSGITTLANIREIFS